uniref:SEC7 domain-containing protein n=1 Tax=Alexandrium monilatum TaxID=311494 RepID=A0A7S4TAY0_9DINO|mmetsp:Transcript_19407/g.58451  ORF Transcript_19407/g.58451 Transcript_19407/m.58451 type:complete len:675 (+) Transcript_19407:40-2064(+)|eukprot:CAMPEP_0175257736 /NCGR_PEP_ID=MMETSP0093-20121207/38869_1 /TAXON_ID=311494 /ORGANISM="Alexandrium monilatum, Strain CCMP3105" /LENGTH=674 /DNA_ID=CAMNT_0016552115 /DNA_START=29 /DNA_END=2053 /DNA_ORIENTATION=+
MGNHSICGMAPQHCVDECARIQMETRSRDAEDPECDPVGTIFVDTLEGLTPINQEALRFAGTANLSAVRWLLAMGASTKAQDKNGTTMLHAACRCGTYSVVLELAKHDPPLDLPDSAGWTPLHISAVMGRRDVTMLLLRVRASVGFKNKRGVTPLMLCSDPGTKEVLEQFSPDGRAPPQQKPVFAELLVGSMPGVTGQPDSMTTCEPFFVPRVPLFHDESHRLEITRAGVEMFSQSVGHGLAFLVATGAVHDHPSDLSAFLTKHQVSTSQLGNFLGEDFSLAQTLRLAFIYSADLSNTGIVGALVKVFRQLRAPPDLVKLDRLTSAVAHLWWRTHDLDDWEEQGDDLQDDGAWSMLAEGCSDCHKDGSPNSREVVGMHLRHQVASIEGLSRLMFSTLMLHWNLHGTSKRPMLPGVVSPRKLSINGWMDMNAGIEADGASVPDQVQRGIYQLISQSEMPELHPSVDSEVAPGQPTPSASSTASGWASVPRGGLERYQPALFAGGSGPNLSHCVLSETTGAPAVQGSLAGPARQQTNCSEEAVWLSLRYSLFLFLSSSPVAAPYAFVRLEDAAVREVSRRHCHLILAGRPKVPDAKPGSQGASNVGDPAALSRTPFGDSSRLPLPLCFLLADGRFQPFEALWLEFQFPTEAELDSWVQHLKAGAVSPALNGQDPGA